MVHETIYPEVILTIKAYNAIVAETYEHINTETGGIFLGRVVDSKWYILEVLDPGPNSTFTPFFFEYDALYVTHLANKIARFYKNGLDLIGLWHRHPGSMDTFSQVDHETHLRYLQQSPSGILSAIINLDSDLRMTMYQLKLSKNGTSIECQPCLYDVDDNEIPSTLLDQKTMAELIGTPIYTQLNVYDDLELSNEKKRISFNTILRRIRNRCANWIKAIRRGDGEITADEIDFLLDQLYPELDYLSTSPDYEYEIEPISNSIALSVRQIYSSNEKSQPVNYSFISCSQREVLMLVNGEKSEYNSESFRFHLPHDSLLEKQNLLNGNNNARINENNPETESIHPGRVS